MTVAVRAPSDEIVIKVDPLPRRLYASGIARLPLLRGTIQLWDALGLGLRALLFSADIALAEPGAEPETQKGNQAILGAVSAVGLLVGVALFFLLPASLTALFHAQFGNALLSNIFEGVLRAGLLVGYLAVIGLMPDMRRVFMYHGAEHKAINAFEAGAPLETSEAARFSVRHPRCGTNFLLIVAVISVAVFALLGRPESWAVLLGSRIVLIPVIAGLAYEAIRWGATRANQPVVRWLMAPGLALQGLSTREPDASQVEVALSALRELLRLERSVAEGSAG